MALKSVRLPDLSDDSLVDQLAQCWEATADTEVPQFRDGECEVRRIWDDAVADVLGWDKDWLAGLRHLLHQEPHVRGLGYNQFRITRLEESGPDWAKDLFRKAATLMIGPSTILSEPASSAEEICGIRQPYHCEPREARAARKPLRRG